MTEIAEYELTSPLIKLIDEIKNKDGLWGLALVKRDYLHSVTKEALLLSLKSLLSSTEEAHAFFAGGAYLYIVWRGKQKRVFQELRRHIPSLFDIPRTSHSKKSSQKIRKIPMKNPDSKPSRAELVAQLQSHGWDLVTNSPTSPLKDRTLEEIVRTAHARHKKGEAPGLIKRIETALELDLIQIQELWEHLGLPL